MTPEDDTGLRTVWVWLTLGVVYLGIAIALTWPLVGRATDGIPLGTERVATVPLFNLWTLAWNARAVGEPGYWDAPIFHPTPAALALSEPQPVTGLLAKGLSLVSGSVVVAYNVLLLLALATNALVSAVACRWVGLGWSASIGGGLLVMTTPFVWQELGVFQLVPLAGVLGLTIGMVRFARRPGLGSGLLWGALSAAAVGISLQTAVFGALALAPLALALLRSHWRSRSAWLGLAAAAALCIALVSPFVAAQQRAFADGSGGRSDATRAKLSAKADHYLISAWAPSWPTPGIGVAEDPGHRAFWPRTLVVLLATAACVLGWRDRTWRPYLAGALSVFLVSFFLSQAGRLDGLLLEWVRGLPGLSQIRSWFRFALFVQLALCSLATLGLHLIGQRMSVRFSSSRAAVLVLALALLATFEVQPSAGRIQDLPPLDLELAWLDWVQERTTPDDVLAFVPFPEGRNSSDYLGTSQWMYWQMRHWRPMVNGYSGFFPASFRALKKTMVDFPSDESLEALGRSGVRYCVVHRAFSDLPTRVTGRSHELTRVFRDNQHALDIFELSPR
ncbi:MAG: hypothetical protein MPN21_08685 [Thermoanaerobaculia bacterium]|nr:hypothetical protein [Thermoanaerobaculia bacterium]